MSKLGYDDTPMLPDSKYRVHDSTRPQPRIVAPGAASTQQAPGKAPSDAVILFDGTSLDGWIGADGKPAGWKLENGYMEVVPKTHCIQSKKHFGDWKKGYKPADIPVEPPQKERKTASIDWPNPTHPYGAKGVGEVNICPPMAAIANAIENAIGVRLTELPMSPPRIRAAVDAMQPKLAAE